MSTAKVRDTIIETRTYDGYNRLVKTIFTTYYSWTSPNAKNVKSILEIINEYDDVSRIIKTTHTNIDPNGFIIEKTSETKTYNNVGLLIQTITETV